ncbi:cell division protein ZapA [Erythrobacter sp. 3-20A1M]|uniref:cell division protein ZapA n=1 Tax=Erythrobacter sp. 3-20A1M TaxID=2653850 RepID=UPI001BFC695A|nr:cell division protein ZapA [Erythrobacter sp. 3-20A1M]QWC58019.1 cell division protein ZapA [Erythrobacter sp. 3-20A1M]
MSEITLCIGGRDFSLTCAAGEEEHVRGLARRIEGKFETLSPRYSHNLLFAALRLADELKDNRDTETDRDNLRERIAMLTAEAEESKREISRLRDTLARLESDNENAPLGATGAERPLASTGSDETLLPALERFAELLEDCADKLDPRTA